MGVDQDVTEDIVVLDRASDGKDIVGMPLSESKQLLKRLQQIIVRQQTDHCTVSPHVPSLSQKTTDQGHV